MADLFPWAVSQNRDPSLGTRLTIQALLNSPAASVQLQTPLNMPLSPDLEDRTSQPYNTTPPLGDRLRSDWELFKQKTQLAGQALKNSFR